ncbi:PadR family transcriptional regulator [Mucilaginibacter sp. PPCGB 2223]|uniref:PadR family transcriptional regulator n=1 Tax=Mucilaginibacter sp. PPCGB 2223 TaxID=1886027 RepID=UPI000826D036|nr:PadR family transcriptional regulator [Mucilaginibacter sp. PPCGB 2223]OCX51981.1 PadR family transcriptional regulator [Mucilaginibacter sp. PPCGB 2223]
MSTNPMLKGTIQTIILKLLEDNRQMYGYEITQKVKELTAGEIKLTEGALYPALHKLEADGLLETSTEIVDNRVRKYYRLTEEGGHEVTSKVNEAGAFIEQLQALLSLKPAIR